MAGWMPVYLAIDVDYGLAINKPPTFTSRGPLPAMVPGSWRCGRRPKRNTVAS